MSKIFKPYIFSNNDVDILCTLGYMFVGIRSEDFVVFMHSNYPGFDLAKLLSLVDQLMVPHSVTKITRRIGVDGNILQVRLENNFTSETNALVFDRKFYRDQDSLKISHEYFVLPEKARGQDIGKKVLKASLEQYLQMKADIVEVVAGLSQGAYVWARHGFVAVDPNDMKRILKKARKKLPDEQFEVVEAIYNAYYSQKPDGDDFPIKNWADLPFMKNMLLDPGCQWLGRLNLKNKEQLRKFEEYVSKQKR